MANPTQQFAWPSSHASLTQIKQLQAAGVTGGSPSANPQTKSPNTQGIPQAVTNLAVSKKYVSSSQVELSINFTHNAGDPYFVTAKVYAKYGNAAPTLISEGSSSPIVFNINRGNVPVSIYVVSSGNWGSTSLSSSPAKTISVK